MTSNALLQIRWLRLCVAALVVLTGFCGRLAAETLTGEVVGLADGDTVTVLDSSHRQHKVRLMGIDAPEKAQPFGTRSKQALSAAVFRQTVTVEWRKLDRYGRIIGRVMVKGRDANLAQVEAGLAWHYVAYASEQAPEDRSAYAAAEARARGQGRGLWQDRGPVAPWDFRHAKRHGNPRP